MKYPTIIRSKTVEIATDRLDGGDPTIGPMIDWRGFGESAEPLLAELDADLRERHAAFVAGPGAKDLDLFEGELAAGLHTALREAPLDMLDDPGFWRYLSVGPLWWAVTYREPPANRLAEKYVKYYDGKSPTECVLVRAFIRGSVTFEAGGYELAGSIPKGTDFWRSHVTRTRTATAPAIAQAFAHSHSARRMPTDELRSYARRLNRMWTNTMLQLYDRAAAESLIEELRDNPEASRS